MGQYQDATTTTTIIIIITLNIIIYTTKRNRKIDSTRIAELIVIVRL
jgi:hypothetical protein